MRNLGERAAGRARSDDAMALRGSIPEPLIPEPFILFSVDLICAESGGLRTRGRQRRRWGGGVAARARRGRRAERRAGAHRHWHRRNLREKSCDGLPGRARPWHLHKTKRGARCTVRAHGGGGSLGRALHADAARKNARMCTARAGTDASRAAKAPELWRRCADARADARGRTGSEKKSRRWRKAF